jgi:hypothetical protein
MFNFAHLSVQGVQPMFDLAQVAFARCLPALDLFDFHQEDLRDFTRWDYLRYLCSNFACIVAFFDSGVEQLDLLSQQSIFGGDGVEDLGGCCQASC